MNTKTDTVVSITKHRKDTGNGSLASALVEAVEEPEVESTQPTLSSKESISEGLPDLSGGVPSLSEEELEAAAEEARKKKEWVEQAAAMKQAALEERSKICSTEGWELVPFLVKKEAELTAKIRQIDAAGDENIHKHLVFAEFLNTIRAVEFRDQMNEVVKHLVVLEADDNGATRYCVASSGEVQRLKSSGMFPETAFFWDEKWHLPYEPSEGEEKKRGQIAVEKEVRKAIRRLEMRSSKQKKKEIVAKMERLRQMDANDDLSGILDGVLGLYRVEVEPVCDTRNKKRIIHHGGIAISRLLNRGRNGADVFVIEPVDGAGCFHWLSGEEGWWISVSSAIFAKAPWAPRQNDTEEDVQKREERFAFISEEKKDKALRFARVLNKNGLFQAWKDRKDCQS
jgi:DNA-directed RNA polymerase subunit E'/Rpb7